MKIVYALLLPFIICAAACSDIDPNEEYRDDETNQTERPSNPSKEENNQEEPPVMIYGMVLFKDLSEGPEGYLEFNYNKNGQLTSIYAPWDEATFAEYTYSENTIAVNYAWGYGNALINLNSNGLASQVFFSEDDYKAKMSYSMNGYISGVKIISDEYSEYYDIKNVNGNFTSIPSTYGGTINYADYTNHADKYSIPLSSIMCLFGSDDMLTSLFPMLKIKGAYSKNLLKRYECEDGVFEFSYEFDKKGNVESMTISQILPAEYSGENYLYFDYGYGFPESMPEVKEKTEDDEKNKQKLVKTITSTEIEPEYESTQYEYNFFYDAEGRIKTITETHDDGSNRNIEYTWDDKNKRMTVSPTSGYTGDPATYYFNDSWVLEKYDSELGTRYMTYHDDGNIYHYETFDGYDFYCEWENGDMTSTTWYQNNEIQSIEYYSYYDTPNKCNIDFLCYCWGGFTPEMEMSDRKIFKNFHSQNLLMFIMDEDEIYFLGYEIDSDGYPTMVTIYGDEDYRVEISIEYYE